MSLELTGPQKKKVREALLAAFASWNELARLTSDELDLNLATITGEGQGLETNAFELIRWAGARGVMAKLIVAMRNARPQNARVQEVAVMLELGAVAVIDGHVATAPVLEKLVNDNVVLLDVEKWRVEQARAEWRVCRIDRSKEGIGTGFLVGPDLVLTNYHVLQELLDPQTDDASGWFARFDHRLGGDGKTLIEGRAVAFATSWYVDHSRLSPFDTKPDPKGGDPTNDELDYALVRLAEPIGDEAISPKSEELRGWVPLTAAKVFYDKLRMISILQHPSGGPMKLAMGMAEKLVLNNAKNRVRHGVPTLPGSSGSPLFDQDWTLIALHHSGDPKSIKPEYNEAIPIALIAARPKVAAALPPP